MGEAVRLECTVAENAAMQPTAYEPLQDPVRKISTLRRGQAKVK